MFELLPMVFSNIIVATAIACIAMVVGRFWRNPVVLHAMWILVLVKLITPPLFALPLIPAQSVVSAERPDPRENEISNNNVDRHLPAELSDDARFPLTSTEYILSSGSSEVAVEDVAYGESPGSGLLALNLWAPKLLESEQTHRMRHAPTSRSSPDTLIALQQRQDSNGSGLNRNDLVVAGESRQGAMRQGEWNASRAIVLLQNLMPVLVAIWIFGVMAVVLRALMNRQRFRKIIKLASYRKLNNNAHVKKRVEFIAGKMSFSQRTETVVVEGTIGPMVWPTTDSTTLILPRRLLKTLNTEQLDSLIAHELSHLLCRHHWFRWFELVVTTVYWWCPLVWLASRKIRQYEEETCDAWVVDLLPGHAESYAKLLLDTVDYLTDVSPKMPATALGISHFQFLKRRITMIMKETTKPRMSIAGWVSLIAIVAVGIPFSLTFADSAIAETSGIQDRDQEERRDKQQRRERIRSQRNQERMQVRREQEQRAREQRVREQRVRDRRDQEERQEVDENRRGRVDIDEQEVMDMVEEITSELEGMDEEIQDAIKEVRQELENALSSEVPESVLRALKDLKIEKLLNDNVKDLPKAVQMFVEEIDVESIIKDAIKSTKSAGRDLSDMDIDMDEIQEELKSELAGELKSLTKEFHKEMANVEKELKRELGGLPNGVKKMLIDMDLANVIKEAAGDASPIGKQILKDLQIEKILNDALAQESDSRRNRVEKSKRQRESNVEDRVQEERDIREQRERIRRQPDNDRREGLPRRSQEVRDRQQSDRDIQRRDQTRHDLEQKIELLMAEVQALRTELRRLDPDRRGGSDRRIRDREQSRTDRDRADRDRADRDRADRDRADRDRADRDRANQIR